MCSVNYNIEWIVLQLEAIRAKQVHKAPPTFPHQQHHFQVLVTWLSIIYGVFFIVKDLRKILQVDIPNWHPLINYLKTHINECKSKCNFLLSYWIFIIILQRVILNHFFEENFKKYINICQDQHSYSSYIVTWSVFIRNYLIFLFINISIVYCMFFA